MLTRLCWWWEESRVRIFKRYLTRVFGIKLSYLKAQFTGTIHSVNVLVSQLCCIVTSKSFPINVRWIGLHSTTPVFSLTSAGEGWRVEPSQDTPACAFLNQLEIPFCHCQGPEGWHSRAIPHRVLKQAVILEYSRSPISSWLLETVTFGSYGTSFSECWFSDKRRPRCGGGCQLPT